MISHEKISVCTALWWSYYNGLIDARYSAGIISNHLFTANVGAKLADFLSIQSVWKPILTIVWYQFSNAPICVKTETKIQWRILASSRTKYIQCTRRELGDAITRYRKYSIENAAVKKYFDTLYSSLQQEKWHPFLRRRICGLPHDTRSNSGIRLWLMTILSDFSTPLKDFM